MYALAEYRDPDQAVLGSSETSAGIPPGILDPGFVQSKLVSISSCSQTQLVVLPILVPVVKESIAGK